MRSWAALGAYVVGLGPLLGPMLAVLGRSWGLCWRSWAALGAYVGSLGAVLGPMLAVFGRSWALCWRSWAALGAYVGDLGSGSGAKLAVFGGLGAKVVGLGSDQGEKWPKPERESDPRGSGPLKPAEAPYRFVYVYIYIYIYIYLSYTHKALHML